MITTPGVGARHRFLCLFLFSRPDGRGCRRLAIAILGGLLATSVHAATPRLVRDINTQPGRESSGKPSGMVRLGRHLLFAARDAEHGIELWRLRAGAHSAELVRDICPGPMSSLSVGSRLHRIGGWVVFSANGEDRRWAPWVSDGTAEETRPLAPEMEMGSSNAFARLGAELLFVAERSDRGVWLWAVADDGGPTLRPVIRIASSMIRAPKKFVHFGERLAFLCHCRDETQRPQLWVTDGTAEGTGPLLGGFPVDPTTELAGTDTALFFTASTDDHGEELWVTDGTAGGTHMVSDIFPGRRSSRPRSLVAAGDRVLFAACGPSGLGLRASDGTREGTVLVDAATLPCSDHTRTRRVIMATARDGRRTWLTTTHAPGELILWLAGEDAGSRPARPVATLPGNSPSPHWMAAAKGRVFLDRSDREHGDELWVSDGTDEGTHMVTDLFPGARSSRPINLTAVGKKLYFAADDGVHGAELWRSDGTAQGTLMVADVFHSTANADPFFLTATRDAVLLRVDDGIHGAELWRTDATAEGTRMVADIRPGGEGSNPANLLRLRDGRVLMSADDGIHGTELWVSDGTAEGTIMLADLASGPASSSPSGLVSAGDGALFLASIGGSKSLWRSDGTTAGTAEVEAAPLAAGWQPVHALPSPAGAYCFSARHESQRDGIWCVHGRESVLVAPVMAQAAAVFGNEMFFSTRSQEGVRLWRSDTTPEGSAQVTVLEGAAGVLTITSTGESLFIMTIDRSPSQGQVRNPPKGSLWYSDGTATGTSRVAGIQDPIDHNFIFTTSHGDAVALTRVGTSRERALVRSSGVIGRAQEGGNLVLPLTASSITSMVVWRNQLLLTVKDRRIGAELWALELPIADLRPEVLPRPEPGSPVLDLRVFNAGPDPASGIRLVLTGASATAVHTDSWQCAATSSGLECESAQLAPWTDRPLGLIVPPPLIGELEIEVGVASGAGDPRHGDNRVRATIRGAAQAFAADTIVSEADTTVALVVGLDAPLNEPLTLRWHTVDGSAIASEDYKSAAGEVTLAAGSTLDSFTVEIRGDDLVEQDENFLIVVEGPEGWQTTATCTIKDDDRLPEGKP